jgi:hypothetical protein
MWPPNVWDDLKMNTNKPALLSPAMGLADQLGVLAGFPPGPVLAQNVWFDNARVITQ